MPASRHPDVAMEARGPARDSGRLPPAGGVGKMEHLVHLGRAPDCRGRRADLTAVLSSLAADP
jgi:hypothetical protein